MPHELSVGVRENVTESLFDALFVRFAVSSSHVTVEQMRHLPVQSFAFAGKLSRIVIAVDDQHTLGALDHLGSVNTPTAWNQFTMDALVNFRIETALDLIEMIEILHQITFIQVDIIWRTKRIFFIKEGVLFLNSSLHIFILEELWLHCGRRLALENKMQQARVAVKWSRRRTTTMPSERRTHAVC
jgi:hypothetical protein